MKKIGLSLILLVLMSMTCVRRGGVRGLVTHRVAGEPLAGVRISAFPPGISTVTDEHGTYVLRVPLKEYTLEYSAAGFEAVEVVAAEMQSTRWYRVDVAMNPSRRP